MNPSMCSVAMAASGKSARRRHLRLNIENQTSIKPSQQVHGAVALVLELAPRWPTARWRPTWYRRLVGCRRLANADTWLLIDTEQRPVCGRTEEQLDDRYSFGGEVGITIVHPGVKDGPGEPGAA